MFICHLSRNIRLKILLSVCESNKDLSALMLNELISSPYLVEMVVPGYYLLVCLQVLCSTWLQKSLIRALEGTEPRLTFGPWDAPL